MRFYFWSAILIASLTVTGLCIRSLALHGIPVSESLILRGLSCLVLVLAFAYQKGLPLVPKSMRTQVLRAGLAGLALTLLSWSYNWLSASSVSVLSNIDVPLLVALGPIIGVPASRKARVLSLISIAFLGWYVSSLESHSHLLYGLSSLFFGSLFLCFGYLFIKKSMNEENQAVAILTPACAILIYGLVERVGGDLGVVSWSSGDIAVGALSGLCMFVAYYATMKLYQLTDLATAEFPTLLSSLAIQPVEFFFLNEPMNVVYVLSAVGFVVTTYLIMRMNP